MRILIAVLLAAQAWGAAFTSKASGDCSSGGQTTWNQVGVPGVNDTVSIGAAHAITCTDWTIGPGVPKESGVLTVNVTAGGSGYTSASVVSFSGGTGDAAQAKLTLDGGAITAVTITYPGRYSVLPTGVSVTVGSGATFSIGTTVTGSGAYAVTVADTGSLTLSGTNTLRGDFGCAAGTSDCLILNAGASLTGDCGAGVQCRIGGSGNSVWRRLRLNGTSASPVDLTGVYFGTGTTNNGGNVVATYTHFTNVGTEGAYAIEPEVTGATGIYYDVQNSTFDQCGCVYAKYQIPAGDHFVHKNNVHTNGVSAVCDLQVSAQAAISGGVREVSGNSFQLPALGSRVGSLKSYWKDFTINDNLFMGGMYHATDAAYPHASFQRNVIRMVKNDSTGVAEGTAQDNWFVVDDDTFPDPRFIQVYAIPNGNLSVAPTLTGNLFENTNKAKPTTDWGDCWVVAYGPQTPTLTVYTDNNISLPDGSGGGSCTMSFGSTYASNWLWQATHNTTMTGNTTDTNGGGRWIIGSGAAGMATDNMPVLKSNIAWAPAATNTHVWLATASVQTDIVTPSGATNNLQWHVLDVGTPDGKRAHGYEMTWSQAVGKCDAPVGPGCNDLWSVNPRFADPYRVFGRFSLAYLGNAATNGAWTTGQTYTTGQTVTHSAATYYAGTTLLYRRIGTAGAEDATTEPGVGASWRTHWEFATVQDLGTWHAATAGAGKTITDGAIGCSACSPAEAMVRWVRRGYVPQNPVVWRAGHDGKTTGAVDVSARLPGAVGMRRR